MAGDQQSIKFMTAHVSESIPFGKNITIFFNTTCLLQVGKYL